jgi:hypothetical protein
VKFNSHFRGTCHHHRYYWRERETTNQNNMPWCLLQVNRRCRGICCTNLQRSSCCVVHATLLFDLCFDPEDVGVVFVQKVDFSFTRFQGAYLHNCLYENFESHTNFIYALNINLHDCNGDFHRRRKAIFVSCVNVFDFSSVGATFWSGSRNILVLQVPVLLSPPGLMPWRTVIRPTTCSLMHASLSFIDEVGVEVNLRPTVSRPVCLGVRHPSGTRNQFFFPLEISFRQLRV